MSEANDHDSLEVLQAPLPREDDFKRQNFRLMGFAVSLALLVMLAPPWLTTWDDEGETPTRIYSGISLIEVLNRGSLGPHSPLGGLGTLLFLAYLLLVLVCLVSPATIVATVCSFVGPVITVVIMMIKPDPADNMGGNTHHVDWTGAPIIAVGLWLVAAVVSQVGWSTTRRSR